MTVIKWENGSTESFCPEQSQHKRLSCVRSSSGIQTRNPSVRASKDSSNCLEVLRTVTVQYTWYYCPHYIETGSAGNNASAQYICSNSNQTKYCDIVILTQHVPVSRLALCLACLLLVLTRCARCQIGSKDINNRLDSMANEVTV